MCFYGNEIGVGLGLESGLRLKPLNPRGFGLEMGLEGCGVGYCWIWVEEWWFGLELG